MSVRGAGSWALAVFGIVLFVAASAVNPLFDAAVILYAILIVSLLVVGALLATRVPGNPIGRWLLAAGLLESAGEATGILSTILATGGPDARAIAPWLALANEVVFFFPIVIVIVVVPLHFPDGRLPSARWRWVAWLTAGGMTAATISNLFGTGENGAALLPNPLAAPEALQPVLGVIDTVAVLTALPAFIGATASVVARYRRAGVVERAQLRWLAADASVAAVAIPASLLSPVQVVADVLFAIGFAAIAGLPVAIGVAILRYRLYDIDRIISRTIGWTIVSGLLLGAFAAVVITLQAALSSVTQSGTLAVAASTLLAFGLFQPVRRRVQRAVDRRFDRARYDGERVVAAFGGRLREHVDLDSLSDDVRRVAEETVRPAGSAIWLRNATTAPNGPIS